MTVDGIDDEPNTLVHGTASEPDSDHERQTDDDADDGQYRSDETKATLHRPLLSFVCPTVPRSTAGADPSSVERLAWFSR